MRLEFVVVMWFLRLETSSLLSFKK